MWEQTLIDSNVYPRRAAGWTIPVAALLHAAFVVVVILFSYWRVEAMEAPQSSLQYVTPIQVTIGPPPSPGQKRSSESSSQSKPAAKVREVQTPVVPRLKNESESSQPAFSEIGTGAEGTDGVEGSGGVEGGDPTSTGPGNSGSGNSGLDEPQSINVNMTQPVLVRRVDPEYPKMALMTHMEGVVILQAIITRTGSVEQVQTLRADFPILEKAAKDAVLQWKYQPATLHGQPAKVYFTVTVTFYLR